MSTPDEVYGRLRKLPASIERGQHNALMAAGQKARTVMLAVPGAPRKVANRTVGVTVKSLGPDQVSVKWSPLARLVDSPTRAHVIGAKGRGAGRRAGSLRNQYSLKGSARAKAIANAWVVGDQAGAGATGAINIKGVGWRAYAFHPGTHGKHFAEVRKKLAVPQATQTYGQKAVTEPLKSVFRG
jgi:hypothetical protein